MTVTNNTANIQPENLPLFGGPTIYIYPSLALALGMNVAIVLYQLGALLEDAPEAEDGRNGTSKTTTDGKLSSLFGLPEPSAASF